MKVSAILAVSENGVIGSDNSLPWRLSNDLQWFKKHTLNKPMIMGRKTFASLPGTLKQNQHYSEPGRFFYRERSASGGQ
nr:dihydrofolate reductase [Sneathiella glossodoripedis]